MEGGPREGRGGAETDAMWAAATGCSACARGETNGNRVADDTGGGNTVAHKGQSSPVAMPSASSPWSGTTIFIPPLPEQTICIASGLTSGAATATPTNNANQTSTRRAIHVEWRRRCTKKLSH